MKITVLYNKPAARFTPHAKNLEAEEDTEESAEEVAAALRSKGASVTVVPIAEDTIPGTVGALSDDLIFNLIEWTGVDAKYAAETYDLLNARGLNYTGATKDNYFLSCDKVAMKQRLDAGGFPTAPWQQFLTGDEPIRKDLPFPVIVKVSLEHSSVGLSKEAIIDDSNDLRAFVKKQIAAFRQPVLAEQFLTGREFQVTLLEQVNRLTVLPPAEVIYTRKTNVPFLTYESRWKADHPDFQNSTVELAVLSETLAGKLDRMSRGVFTTMGFRDYARFDIRCLGENPMFLEVNSNPGLSDDQQYGMTVSYKAVGMSFADFVWEIVLSAMRRITG